MITNPKANFTLLPTDQVVVQNDGLGDFYTYRNGDIWVDEFKNQFFFHQAYVLHPFESTQKRFSFSEGTMTLCRECDAFAAVSFCSLLLSLSALFLVSSFVQGVHFVFS